MKKEIKIYHLCNLSPKVLFRNEEDYLVAICRLAACAFETGAEVWAYSFMSTHFHLIVRTAEISAFVRLFRINMSRWHNHKYNASIRVNIGVRQLADEGAVRIATNYVLKNPIHHGLAEVAFQYPYSSAHVYFKEKIGRSQYYSGEYTDKRMMTPSELGPTQERVLFGSHKLPESYKIQEGKVIAPETFLKVENVCILYKSVRNYLYNMTKPLDEELRMFGQDLDSINLQESRVSLFGKLTDMQVCSIIDEYLAPKTYTQATCGEIEILSIMLREKGVDKYQIERCL